MINVTCKKCGLKYLWPAVLPGYAYPWCPKCGSKEVEEFKKEGEK